MPIRQTLPTRFPSGDFRTVAVLRYEPTELEVQFGITFHKDYDDLDYHQIAALEDNKIGQILLFRYRNFPAPGTEVRVDSTVDVMDALERIKNLLTLQPEDIVWTLGVV